MTRAVLLTTLALALAAMLAYAGGVVVFYIWPDGVAVEYNATAPSPAAFNYTAVVDCATGAGRAVLRAGDAYVVVSLPEGNATAWPPAAAEFAKQLTPTVPKNSTGTLAIEIVARNGTAYAWYRGCKLPADPADPRTHWWAVLYYASLLRNVNLTKARFVGMNNVTVSPTEVPFSLVATFNFWLNITLPKAKPPAPAAVNKTAPANATVVQTPANATSTPTNATTQTPIITTPWMSQTRTPAFPAANQTWSKPPEVTLPIATETLVVATSTTTPASTSQQAPEVGGGDAFVRAALLVALAAALIIAAVALRRLKR